MAVVKPDINRISLDRWENTVFRENNLEVSVLRLDKMHPEISGNKWFKLKYYLETARERQINTLVSFGGAYSNHLLGLAAAADLYGFTSIGYIRGEAPSLLSDSLQAAAAFGMQLRFLPRTDYNRCKRSLSADWLHSKDSASLLIPEGGAGPEGRRGAGEILDRLPLSDYSHICVAVGTGTTMAGLINSVVANHKIIGVSVLKGTRDNEPLDISWIEKPSGLANFQLIHSYHFGGYAKCTKVLIDFMNRVYADSGIPTDFVYTGKLFFAVEQMAAGGAFPAGSRILILHTGGLNGNRSLNSGTLRF